MPQRLLTGEFLFSYREKRGKEKWKRGKWRIKEGKLKREGGKLKMEGGKSSKMRRGPFFFFFFFHFSKQRKFVLGLPKWKFSTGKKHFTPGKKSREITLPPQKKKNPVTPLRRTGPDRKSPCGEKSIRMLRKCHDIYLLMYNIYSPPKLDILLRFSI